VRDVAVTELVWAVRAERERERLQRSLRDFMRAAWVHLEPKRPLVWGWHIDAILEHVQAALLGEIDELVVNVPPRHIKSTLISIISPTWLWARKPEARFLTSSYGLNLALRDASRSRKLIMSPWYRRTFPGTELVPYQKAKGRYETTEGGWRVASSITGIGTGEGGDCVLVDDPLKAGDANSEAKIQEVIDWWDETMPTRLDDPAHGTRIVVMQRLHERDLTGHILAERSASTVHLCLPARYDPTRHCVTKWFEDPRKRAGEPLWPERFGERELSRLEAKLSPRAVASQLQQTPSVEGGNILKRKYWRIWSERQLPQCSVIMISVDPSVKEGEQNDPWAVQVWGLFKHQDDTTKFDRWHMMLLRAHDEHLSYPAAKRFLMQAVSDWTIEDEPPDYVLIEDKASGPNLIAELELAGVKNLVRWNPGKDSKVTRAIMASDQFFSGLIWVPGKVLSKTERSAEVLPTWAEMVVDQCAKFTGDADQHDDQVDACTQAVQHARKLGYLTMDSDPDDWQDTDAREDRRRESAYG
jgi:predicted phage terminase large subunit-like protein